VPQLPEARTDSFVDAVSGLAEEPPMDGFENLVKVKITNFKWQCNEIELVHFLFRKARSLQKLILVVPKGTNPDRDQSGNAIFPDLSLLCACASRKLQRMSRYKCSVSFLVLKSRQFIEISF